MRKSKILSGIFRKTSLDLYDKRIIYMSSFLIIRKIEKGTKVLLSRVIVGIPWKALSPCVDLENI